LQRKGYELTGSSITELNIEVRDIRSFDANHLETPNITRFSVSTLDEDEEDDEFNDLRQDLKRSAMQKLTSTIEYGLPKLEVLKLYSFGLECDSYRIKSELVSTIMVLKPLENCPKLTKLNGHNVRH